MEAIGLEVCGCGKHKTKGMVERRPIGGELGAFETSRADFYPSGTVWQQFDCRPQIDGDVEGAGQKVPQRIVKYGQVECPAHIDPAGYRCLHGKCLQAVV